MRVLLTLVAVLAIASSAMAINGANYGVVDDFESYDAVSIQSAYKLGNAWDSGGGTVGAWGIGVGNGGGQGLAVSMLLVGSAQISKIQADVQNIWGGPTSTHIKFDIKGDSSNDAAGVTMQMNLGGAETNAAGFVFPLTQPDFASDSWQTITVVPVVPGWNTGPGWWGLTWDLIGTDDGRVINYTVDNVILVPEPATMLLLGLGGLFMRRKK